MKCSATVVGSCRWADALLEFPAKPSPAFQASAGGLVGEVVCTYLPGEARVCLCLYEISRRYGLLLLHYLVLGNRLASAEEAFTLLHCLSHLNGHAFRIAVNMSYLNPGILRALTDHHHARGDTYRLHYRPQK